MQGVQWLEGVKKDIPEETHEQVLKDEQEFTRRKKRGKSILGRGNSICKGKEAELRV